jgi:hypothetical protein
MIMDRPTDLLPPDLRPPAPPARLRARVLTAARNADTIDSSADLWHRLWSSRPLRVAWAASVVILIIGHLLIGSKGSQAPPTGPTLPVTVAVTNAGELAEVAELGRLTAELPGWEVAVSTHRGARGEGTSS